MRSTRLEFMIVTIAFVVLLLCSRPPKPGNAEPSDADERIAPSGGQTTEDGGRITAPSFALRRLSSAPEETPAQAVDVAPPEIATPSKPPTKRMAVVDARNCSGLDYRDLMYGEVTVRWVWDGSKFVPRKVCVVQEPGGVTSVWSFDQPGKAILTEIGETPLDP